MERLQKIIAQAGVASRRKAEELIAAGKVKVNGIVVTELGTKVSEKDETKVCGYTNTMKLVNVKAPKETIGKIISVKITDAKSFSLDGEIV